jgi:hypothetical protein
MQQLTGMATMEFFILSLLIPLWTGEQIVKHKRLLEQLSLILGFGFFSVYFYLKDHFEFAVLCLCLCAALLALALYIQIFKREEIEIRTLPADSYKIYTEDGSNTAVVNVRHRIAFDGQEYTIAAPSIVGTPALKLYLHKDPKNNITNVDAVPVETDSPGIKGRLLMIYMYLFSIAALLSPIVYLLVWDVESTLYYIFMLVFVYGEMMFRGSGNLLIRVMHAFSIFMIFGMLGVFVSSLL